MTADAQFVKEKQDEATSARKKGDARRKAGNEDAARAAFGDGVAALEQALEVLRRPPWPDIAPDAEWSRADRAKESAEALGARGGLLQRLGDANRAFESYTEGAAVEKDFALSETYNRVNAVKYALMTGRSQLAALVPDIHALVDIISERLSPKPGAPSAEGGWLYADLGDCSALLGDLERAQAAYATLIAKSETKSPQRTLAVLSELASTLTANNDPAAANVTAAVAFLTGRLAAQA